MRRGGGESSWRWGPNPGESRPSSSVASRFRVWGGNSLNHKAVGLRPGAPRPFGKAGVMRVNLRASLSVVILAALFVRGSDGGIQGAARRRIRDGPAGHGDAALVVSAGP